LKEKGLRTEGEHTAWISVPCNFCGRWGGELIHREGQHKMWKCPSCDFIYLNPRPSQTSLLSSYQTYLPDDESGIEAWHRMMMPVFSRAADFIEKIHPRGRILDIGTGYGYFLSEMKRRGYETLGLEISHTGVKFAREQLGLTVIDRTLEEAQLPDNHFHAVAAFYLIEHLPNPIGFLRECYRILKPGGLILLRYPHTTPIKDFLALFGIPNTLYDTPYHLSDFSPKTVKRFLEKAGFRHCQSYIGGYTLPRHLLSRVVSRFFGSLSQALFSLSGNRILFPGVSKMATGRK
jgi:2-polyprenyl-3-methyl-5-hydroxy-6-metoxy-1,4-benzoquinol methylase